jgi:hypothetical protein
MTPDGNTTVKVWSVRQDFLAAYNVTVETRGQQLANVACGVEASKAHRVADWYEAGCPADTSVEAILKDALELRKRLAYLEGLLNGDNTDDEDRSFILDEISAVEEQLGEWESARGLA